MRETSLDRVLRLAGGATRSYVRQEPTGQQVRVRQYPTPRLRQLRKVVPGPRAGHAQFRQLAKGQIVNIAGQRYRVVRTEVPQGHFTPSVPQGAAAQQARLLFGTPRQNPQLAALGGKPIPAGTKTMTTLLYNVTNGYSWYVTLPVNLAVTVEN